MFFISNKIGTLAAFLGPLPFDGSFRGILFRALAAANTLAFFLAKPWHLTGISEPSGMAIFIRGKGTTAKKFRVINCAIFSNPEG
jgi:hypothetical protein